MKLNIGIWAIFVAGLGTFGIVWESDSQVVVDTRQVSEEDPNEPTELVKDILDIFDEHAVGILAEATSFQSAISGNRPTSTLQSEPNYKPSRQLCDFEVSEEGRILTKSESAELISMILDNTNYEYKTYSCIFNPKYAFTCYTEADTISVVLTAQCLSVHLCRGAHSYGFGTLTLSGQENLDLFAARIWGRKVDRGYN
jgi:hypothetical protein